MFGIILASHGNMAEGMLDSAKLFFGDNIEKIQALCIHAEEDPEKFDDRIKNSIEELDDGCGVLILVDLFGGTPGNRAAVVLRNPKYSINVKVVTGMNFTMLLEVLGTRPTLKNIHELDVTSLMETGRDGIKYINELLAV